MNPTTTQIADLSRAVAFLADLESYSRFLSDTGAPARMVAEHVTNNSTDVVRLMSGALAVGRFRKSSQVVLARELLRTAQASAALGMSCPIEALLSDLRDALAALSRGLYDL